MTTIVARRNGEAWDFAWDSRVSYGSMYEDSSYEKVFFNDELLFGVSGTIRNSNIVRHAKLPKIKATDKDTAKWVVNTLMPALIKVLRDNLSVEVHNENIDAEWGVLLWVRGEVFDIGSDFSAIKVDSYSAVGSGSRFAYAALDMGASAKRAVKIAKGRDLHSGGQVHFLTVEVA